MTLQNLGMLEIISASLSTAASVPSLLTSDTTNGLQMVVDQCPTAWTESGAFPYTYTCATAPTTLVASTPVIGSDLPLTDLTSPPAANNLRVTLTLPDAAGNTLQDLTPSSTSPSPARSAPPPRSDPASLTPTLLVDPDDHHPTSRGPPRAPVARRSPPRSGG